MPVVVYVYLDNSLAFKFYIKSSRQAVNFEFEIFPTAACQTLKLRFFDPSESTNMNPDDSEGDDDRDFYNHIGDCVFKVDKLLANLLIEDRYDIVKNIVLRDDLGPTSGFGEESLESEEFLT